MLRRPRYCRQAPDRALFTCAPLPHLRVSVVIHRHPVNAYLYRMGLVTHRIPTKGFKFTSCALSSLPKLS